MTESFECPAATGIITGGPDHPGEPHRCAKPMSHMRRPEGGTDPDHICACGKAWTSGPTIQDQLNAMESIRRRHDQELSWYRANLTAAEAFGFTPTPAGYLPGYTEEKTR
jgi:hypothetical protein